MAKLPSAEKLALKHHKKGTPSYDLLRHQIWLHGQDVLKAAAQEALDHPEAPAEAILKLREN